MNEANQLHSAEFIYKCHVSRHNLLQGVVEFTQLFQCFLLCLLILIIIQVFSGKEKSAMSDSRHNNKMSINIQWLLLSFCFTFIEAGILSVRSIYIIALVKWYRRTSNKTVQLKRIRKTFFFRKWPSSLQVLNWDRSIFLPFCTCIPPDPPAAASACPVALPCFVSVFQSLISRAKPSLVYKNGISNLQIAQKNTSEPTTNNT